MAKFSVTYTIHGEATDTVEAESLDDARKMIADRIDDDSFEIDLDSVDHVDFRVAELHPVTRDGRKIWTTHRLASDVPGHAEAAS